MKRTSHTSSGHRSLFALTVLFAYILTFVIAPVHANALTNEQTDALRQNLTWFNTERDSSCSSSNLASATSNADYAGNPILTDAQLVAIESNKPFYEKAASANEIPWEVLAAIHIRETGLKRYGPANGYGPYQITPSNYPIKDSYTDAEFQDATDKAAAIVKEKAGGKDLADPDNVKYVFFSYNGMASVYVQQAKSLGFSDAAAANGEGSPYVMNRFDLKRDPTVEPTKSNNTWGQIKVDYGSVSYPANPDYGAFPYYVAISGGSGSFGCNAAAGDASALNGDASALMAKFADYMKSNNNTYGAYVLGSNGCTTLSAWFIGEYTDLVYGHGNGEGVVRQTFAANPGKGLSVTNTPKAMSLYSVAPNLATWGGSGVVYGHVGLVVSVDEAKQEATVIQTGASAANKPQRGWVTTYKYPQSGVTFLYIGDHLK